MRRKAYHLLRPLQSRKMLPEPDTVAFLTRFRKDPLGDSGGHPKVGGDYCWKWAARPLKRSDEYMRRCTCHCCKAVNSKKLCLVLS
jgi:hypothetical protein